MEFIIAYAIGFLKAHYGLIPLVAMMSVDHGMACARQVDMMLGKPQLISPLSALPIYGLSVRRWVASEP